MSCLADSSIWPGEEGTFSEIPCSDLPGCLSGYFLTGIYSHFEISEFGKISVIISHFSTWFSLTFRNPITEFSKISSLISRYPLLTGFGLIFRYPLLTGFGLIFGYPF